MDNKILSMKMTNFQLESRDMAIFGKVCSINFEPPDIDFCSACHVYTISRGAWIISILFILNRFTWESN